MKTFRPAPPVFRALLALLLFAACSSVPAQAQASGWQFDHFECTGSTQWTPGSTTQTFLWPAFQGGSPEIQFGLNQYGAPCQSVGTICAVFTWQGSGQPSDSLPVLIFSSAGIYGTPPQPDPDDGFQDPLIPSGTPASKTSKGWHVVKLSNSGGSTTLKTDVCSLSAICGPSDDAAGSGTYIDFQVHMAGAALYGYSTHCAPGLGGSDPNWDPSHPRYFSGTGCEAMGVAAALSGNVAHAQLCIGENGSDTVVNEYFDGSASGGPSAASVLLNAMFDSAHFKDQAKIKLTLKVWDTNGGYYELEVMGPAYNKALVLANNTFGDSATQSLSYVNSVAEGMQYSTFPSMQLHSQDITSKIPAYTAFYIDTHGGLDNGNGDFTDCFATGQVPPDTDDNTIFQGEVMLATDPKRAKKAYPPYNFVFLDACITLGDKFDDPNTANNTALAQAFGIPLPGGGSDRALVGFNWYTFPSEDNAHWTQRVWELMALGVPLRDSIILSSAVEPCWGKAHLGFWTSVSPVIQGDESMTLRGVYGGTRKDYGGVEIQGAPGQIIYTTFIDDWFRPL